jgi:hypothetical protein
MKRTIIFSTVITILVFAAISQAQVSSLRVTFSESRDNSRDTTLITYTGLENPDARVFESVVPGPAETCFEATVFPNPRPVGSDRASLVYDAAAGAYKLKWTVKRDTRDSCRVLFVADGDGDVDGADFLVWQRNYGSTLQTETGLSGYDAAGVRGDGSVRFISYQISAQPWSSRPLNLKVRNPGRGVEVIEAAFPAPPDNNYLIFEDSFSAASEADCLANQDFTNAVPVGPDRAIGVYDPASAIFRLKNSLSAPPPCHVTIAGATPMQAGYNLWRTNFGRTSLVDDGHEKKSELNARDPDVGSAFTYTLDPRTVG